MVRGLIMAGPGAPIAEGEKVKSLWLGVSDMAK